MVSPNFPRGCVDCVQHTAVPWDGHHHPQRLPDVKVSEQDSQTRPQIYVLRGDIV